MKKVKSKALTPLRISILMFLFFLPIILNATTPIANYQMDACSWNGTTGEVKDSSGNGYNGTAENGANTENNTTAGGGLCRVGDFIGSKHIKLQNSISIGSNYTVTLWIKFPLDSLNHKTYCFNAFGNSVSCSNNFARTRAQYYNIADREGSLNSFIFFDKYQTKSWGGWSDWKWVWAVDDINGNPHYSSEFTMPSNGWHMVTFVANSSENKTKIFIDDNYKDEINYALTNISLNRIGASDYQNNDGNQTIGAYIDEVKIFDKTLSDSKIQQIYDNEKDGKNYDGTNRICPFCGIYMPIANYQMDACSWNGTTGEVKDSSGNGYDATAKGGATTAKAQLCEGGKLLNNGNYIESTKAPILSSYTFSAWVKAPNGNYHPIFFKADSSNIAFKGPDDIEIYIGNGLTVVHNRNNGGRFDYVYAPTPPNNEWFHLAITYDAKNKDLKIYYNGELKKEETNFTTPLNTQNKMFLGKEGRYYLNGYLDEVKIYNQALSEDQIQAIYDNEKDGKNYDGTNRICLSCSGGIFDAWDIFRSINDRNISTKIVNQEFNLTIASLDKNKTKYQEFNGTVCAKVDNNITKIDFRDQNEANATFKISRAIRDAKVEISWKKDIDENCPLQNENNESNSTDDFAIRPKEFNISNYPAISYAGEDFNISFEALGGDDKNATDYNESNGTSFDINVNENKSGCVTGAYSGDVHFSNGGNTTVANYDEVGYIDINISDKDILCENRFAHVDCKDKNVTGYWNSDTNTSIGSKDINITVKPYDLNLTYNITPKDWVYMDSNLSEPLTYVELNATLSAYAKGKTTTLRDFNSTCYAKDINISFLDTNITKSDDFNGTYYDVIKDVNLTDINFTDLTKDHNWTIRKGDFAKGEGNLSIRFNIDRNYSKAISPIDINFTDINITTPNIAKKENNTTMDKNISFYYGRVITHDIETTEQNITSSFLIDVYCDNCSNQINKFFQDSLNWYRNGLDNGIIQKSDIKIEPKSDISLSSSDKSDINISNITDAQKGKVSFDINNSKNSYDTAVLHVLIPKWLWFNDYRAYDDNSSSDCSTHPCIGYKLLINTEKSIESGIFQGSDIGYEQNRTIKKIGIKVYR